MGASQEKKRRRADRENGIDKKIEESVKQADQKKKNMRNMKIAAAAILVFTLVVAFFSIPAIYGSFTAVTVDGEDISVAEYNYYYNTLYSAYYQRAYANYGEYYSMVMPSEEEIRGEVITTLRTTVKLYKEGKAAGFELDEAQQAECEEFIGNYEKQAESSGFTNFNQYLKTTFGKPMTEKIFKEQAEYFFYATEYANSVYDAHEISVADVEEYYDENKDDLDYFVYRVFEFDGTEVKDDPDTEEDESVDSETAMQEAIKLSKEFEQKVKYEQDFIDLAYEYAPEADKPLYRHRSATRRATQKADTSSFYVDWLMDPARKAGDVTAIEGDAAAYVVYFLEREDNRYTSADIRMLYIAPDIVNQNEYDNEEAYDDAIDAELKEAKEEIEAVYNEFLDGEKTPEAFEALVEEYDERGDGKQYYQNVRKYQFYESVDSWIFDEKRSSGDAKIFYIENDGFYIVYYEKPAERYDVYLSDTALRDEAHAEWEKELEASAEFEINEFWYKFTA